jgi:hypothetical protein
MRYNGTDLGGDVAVVDDHVIDADLVERFGLCGVTGRGEDDHVALLGQHRGRHSDRGCAAADQNRLTRLDIESEGQ